MESSIYVEKKKSIQAFLLSFLDKESDFEEHHTNFINCINDQRLLDDPHEVKMLLHMIYIISNNHNRTTNFFDKIDSLLLFLKPTIQIFFSAIDVFNIFKGNKRILLSLFENKIIIINQQIAEIMKSNKYIASDYPIYFFPELQPFFQAIELYSYQMEINQMNQNGDIMNDFALKRKIGENHNYICSVMRDDNIEAFIIYINKYGLNSSSFVHKSAFETHQFLLKNQPTLLEYAAFFGSIQIFKFLINNGAQPRPQLWSCAIFGCDPELINILIEKNIAPAFCSYKECINTAIKCHHNEIANYIYNNFFQTQNIEEVFDSATKYYNFMLFPKNFNSIQFYNFCLSDFYNLVNIILQEKQVDINAVIVLMPIFILSNFKHVFI